VPVINAASACRDADTGTGGPHGGSDQPVERHRGFGAGALGVLLLLLCCGGPFLVVALVGAGAVTRGVIGRVLGGLVLVVPLAIWLRRRCRSADAASCPPLSEGWSR